MDFPKKQAQRLMPLYLLEYSEKLFTNHPNPEDPWGGGSDYTAGQGITITNNEISVDTNVIATKSDIAQMVTTTQLNDALDDYALKTEIPTDVSQLTNDSGYATQTWVENQGYLTNSVLSNVYRAGVELSEAQYKVTPQFSGIEYSKEFEENRITIDINKADLENKASIVVQNNGGKKVEISNRIDVFNDPTSGVGIEGDKVAIHAPNGYVTSLEDGKLVYTDQNGVRNFNLNSNRSSGNYTLAVLEDIPYSPFLKVDDPQGQMFFSLDGSDYSWSKYVDLSSAPGKMFYVNLSALNPVFKDGLTSTYNEQTNQLEVGLSAPIPDTRNFVTTDTNQSISGSKYFDSGKLIIDKQGPIHMRLIFTPYMFSYSTNNGVTHFKLPTSKPSGTDTPTEYTLATTDDIPSLNDYALKTEVPSTATSTSTSTVTPTTGTFVTGTSTNTANVVNSVTYTPSSETLTFTYADNTTASFTFLTSSTTVTSGTTSVVTSVTDSTSNAMTGATVSTSTTTTLS